MRQPIPPSIGHRDWVPTQENSMNDSTLITTEQRVRRLEDLWNKQIMGNEAANKLIVVLQERLDRLTREVVDLCAWKHALLTSIPTLERNVEAILDKVIDLHKGDNPS